MNHDTLLVSVDQYEFAKTQQTKESEEQSPLSVITPCSTFSDSDATAYQYNFQPDPKQWSINYGCTCIKEGDNDGAIDPSTGIRRWKCRNKYCPRHWAGYAYGKYKEVADNLGRYKYWYNIRLSTFLPYTTRINEALRRWVKKIQNKHPGCEIHAVFHQKKNMVHIHVLLGTNEPCLKETVTEAWRKHCPYERTFHGNHVYFKRAKDPINLLKYFFWKKKKTKDEKKDAPPWAGCDRKEPYQGWKLVDAQEQAQEIKTPLPALEQPDPPSRGSEAIPEAILAPLAACWISAKSTLQPKKLMVSVMHESPDNEKPP